MSAPDTYMYSTYISHTRCLPYFLRNMHALSYLLQGQSDLLDQRDPGVNQVQTAETVILVLRVQLVSRDR